MLPQPLPPPRWDFPDPSDLDPIGPVAVGGDFAPEHIINAYRHGIFPWPHDNFDYLWFSPDPRAHIPLGGLHISRRLARTIRSGRFKVTQDSAFGEVIRACNERRPDGIWITPNYIEAYEELHRLGWAHSFEAWSADGSLAGGVYGLAVGALFGAESMFHRETDASKVALAALMAHCERVGTVLFDIQMLTPHTASLGAVEIPRAAYLKAVRAAIATPLDFTPDTVTASKL